MSPGDLHEAPREEQGLELERWGTRFARPEAEAAYALWNLERSAAGFRAACWASIAFWTVAFGLYAWARPAGFGPWGAAIGSVFALIGGMFVAVRTRSVLIVEVAGTASIAISGGVGIAMTNVHLHAYEAAVAGTCWACFFHLTMGGLRLSRVAPAVASYVVLEAWFLGGAASSGQLDVPLAAIEGFAALSAYGTGLMVAVVGAARSHASYRQERIIEAQKATIARQQELLKRELSHQVAERSRELGAVLARSDVTLDARKLSPGERFAERYRVVAALGAGGMGAVYEVERVTDGHRLALKAVVGEVSGASAARFAREAEIGARIHHEHLVSIVDVGVSSGVPFLVMELVRGGSLEAQRTKFGDVAWALPILRQIAEGLAALHDAGVVHRDLKPANVLLAGTDGAPVAKISDFGISRFGALDEAASIDPNAVTMGASPSPKAGLVTGTGVIMGTPLYMAPEAAKGGRALDASADVFALGIIAYEMLTGRAPFTVPAVMLAMAEQPTPTPAAIDDARVPAALRGAVLDCLAGDPTKRPRVRAVLAGIA